MGKKKGRKTVYKPFDENKVSSHSTKTEVEGKNHNESIPTEKDITPSNIVHSSDLSVNSNSTLGGESINSTVELSFNKEESGHGTINRTDFQNDPDCQGSTTSFTEIKPEVEENNTHFDKSHNNERDDGKRDHKNARQSHSKLQEPNRDSMRKDDTQNYRNRRFDNGNRFKAGHDLTHDQRDSNTNIHTKGQHSYSEQQKDDSWNDPADNNMQPPFPKDKKWNESSQKNFNQNRERGDSYNFRGQRNNRGKRNERSNMETNRDYNKDRTFQSRNFVNRSGGRSGGHQVFAERSHLQTEKQQSHEDNWGESIDTKSGEIGKQGVPENVEHTQNYTQDIIRIHAVNVVSAWTKQSDSGKSNEYHNANIHARENYSQQQIEDSQQNHPDNTMHRPLPKDTKRNDSYRRNRNDYGERDRSNYNFRGNRDGSGKRKEQPNFVTGQRNRDHTSESRNFDSKTSDRSDRRKVNPQHTYSQEQTRDNNFPDEKQQSHEDNWGESIDTKSGEIGKQGVPENVEHTQNYTQDFSRIHAVNVDSAWTKQSDFGKSNKYHNTNIHAEENYSQQQTEDSQQNHPDSTMHRPLPKDKKRNDSYRRNRNDYGESDRSSYNFRGNRDGSGKRKEQPNFVTGQRNRDQTSETKNFDSKTGDRSDKRKVNPQHTYSQEQTRQNNFPDEKQQLHEDWNDIADKDRAEITDQTAQESNWSDEHAANYTPECSTYNTENVDGWADQPNTGNLNKCDNNTGQNEQSTSVDFGNWNTTLSADVSSNKSSRPTDYQDDTDHHWRGKNNRSFPMQSYNKDTSKRHSEGTNSENFKEKSKSWREKDTSWTDRNIYDRQSEKIDAEYKQFLDEERKKLTVEYVRVKEIQGDLFEMPKEYSLGHCVAEDMRMGSGIAVTFKREFKDIDVLLNQRPKQGGLAVLEDESQAGVRYVYYLVTKRESTGKPTYEKFWSSIQKMRNHIREHGVKKLAIPRLGCGLDRLEWSRVKHMIEFLFKDVETEITVCNFQQTEDSPEKPQYSTCKLVHVQKSIADIEEETIILYLSTEDGYVSKEMEELSKKFNFLTDFKRARKQFGEAIKYQVPNKYYILYGCIVRKTINDPFDFVSFRKCLTHLNNNNKKDPYVYVAIQAVVSNNDDLLMEKIITILRNYLRKVDVYVCWDGELSRLMPLSHRDS